MTPGASSLQVGGFVPFTTVDFPGHLAAVVFCQGCPWRCRYCHNPHLRSARCEDTGWSWGRVRGMLEERRGFLEAVVFSGGEPTFQTALPSAIEETRSLGFEIGLHTAGIYPDRLEELLPIVDWIGLDVKAPFDTRYERVTGVRRSAMPAARSLEIVLASGVPFELRTTVHPVLTTENDMNDLRDFLRLGGEARTKIQPFRPEGCLDPELLAYR